MKALEKGDKNRIKLRFAAGLYKALKASSWKSFRKLAEEAGMEPAHIQKISAAKLDITLTTCISIATALNISYTDFASYYDMVTEKDIEEFSEHLASQIRVKGKKEKK